jgi:hypothetical protein
MIHVLDALAGIRVDQLRGLARPLHAGETRHIAARRFVGFSHAETATIPALPLGVGHMPGAILRLVRFPTTQPVLFSIA